MRNTGTLCVNLGVALAAAWLIAVPVQAQSEPASDEARIAFQAGRDAFEAGRYALALESFERAYELTQHPDILYNIAHTAERLRNDERALSAFESYLSAHPDSEERPSIEARMAILRQAIADRNADEGATDVPPAPPESHVAPLPVRELVVVERPAEQGPSPLGWVLTGAGAVVTVTGVGFLIGAEVRAGEVRDASDGTLWPTLEQAYADADNFAIAGGVLVGVGVATAALGVVLALTDQGDSDVAVGPGVVRGRF